MQRSLHQISDIHYISVIKTYCKVPVLVYNNRFIHRLKVGLLAAVHVDTLYLCLCRIVSIYTGEATT